MDLLDTYLEHHRACPACAPADPERNAPARLCGYARTLWRRYRADRSPHPSPSVPSAYPLGGLDESGWEE